MAITLLEEHAREINGFSADWSIYEWECLPHQAPTQTYKLTGVVAPLVTRGPNKGERNWRRKDRSTKRTVYITPEQHKIWLEAWEVKTGKCHACQGEGKVVESVSIRARMTYYRQCGRCEGSGARPVTTEALVDGAIAAMKSEAI